MASGAAGHGEREDHLATTTSDLGDPLTLKAGELFLLTDCAGEIPATAEGDERGLGLYFHDMRHLDLALLRLNGAQLTPLLASDDLGYRGVRELTNPEITLDDGRTLRKEVISIQAETILDGGVRETLTVRNFSREQVTLTLTLEYAAHFADIFAVRGMPVGRRGHLHTPEQRADQLTFRYDGADEHRRSTRISFSPPPGTIVGGRAIVPLHLAPGATYTQSVTIAVEDHPPGHGTATAPHHLWASPGGTTARQSLAPTASDILGGGVTIETDNDLFNRVLRRSFLDLAILTTRHGDDQFFAAGIPWFVALFGRDSLLTALQTLAFNPAIARSTLALLARYQGQRDDPSRDEEPGKILHELRIGEMANLREVPFTPYYGTVDATPLFLILLGEYLRWTGDRAFFATLRPQVEAALSWLDRASATGDGFLTYTRSAERGLDNQGWKDSANGIVDASGAIVASPVALVEVQGYAYRARRTIAAAYRQSGEPDRADALEEAAERLRRQFEERFWLPERANYALALGGAAAVPAAVDGSNQGQALWGGIVAPDRAAAVRDTLLDPARLFAGWGVRTLSRAAAAYNPFDYQVGAVWPHDGALIAAGLRNYGFNAEALQIFAGLYEAATRFDHYRLPELFAGFGRDDHEMRVRYPVACSPQAWAAGALPFLLVEILGLIPEAAAQTLRVVRPTLPDWLMRVTIRGIRVGDGRADLRYERSGATTLTTVLRQEGSLRVVVEG